MGVTLFQGCKYIKPVNTQRDSAVLLLLIYPMHQDRIIPWNPVNEHAYLYICWFQNTPIQFEDNKVGRVHHGELAIRILRACSSARLLEQGKKKKKAHDIYHQPGPGAHVYSEKK